MNDYMPRGGKRPGAGAPRANLNRLTRAARSKQVQQAIENALQDPKGRVLVNTLVRKYHQPGES